MTIGVKMKSVRVSKYHEHRIMKFRKNVTVFLYKVFNLILRNRRIFFEVAEV